MATRRYSTGPNENVEAVVEAVGAATVTKSIELTFDHQTAVKGTGNPRTTLDRDEVLAGIMRIHDYIAKGNWPPS